LVRKATVAASHHKVTTKGCSSDALLGSGAIPGALASAEGSPSDSSRVTVTVPCMQPWGGLNHAPPLLTRTLKTKTARFSQGSWAGPASPGPRGTRKSISHVDRTSKPVVLPAPDRVGYGPSGLEDRQQEPG
jgi:hypothetical protein